MVVNFLESVEVGDGGKNVVRNEYSNVALSIRARLKWKNGASM